MSNDLGELILKVGGYPSFHLSHTKGKMTKFKNCVNKPMNHDIWIISWNHSKNGHFTAKKIEESLYDDMVYCIELKKNHVMWVRHNGKTCFSGNCRCAMLPVVANTSVCRGFGKSIEKAACIPSDNLHDEQIKDLLQKIEEAGKEPEASKYYKALRKLGHKGGLRGKPPVIEPPTIKPPVIAPKPLPTISTLKPGSIGDAKSIGQAEVDARNIMGLTARPEAMSYQGLDLKVANNFNKALSNIKNTLGESPIKGIRTEIFKKKGEYIFVNPDGTLVLNREFFSSYSKAAEEFGKLYKKKWWMSKLPEDILYHEAGHSAMYNYLSAKYSKKQLAKILEKINYDITFSSKGLSKYATMRGDEGIAEVFVKYFQTGSLKNITIFRGAKGRSVMQLIKEYTGITLKSKPLKPKPAIKPKPAKPRLTQTQWESRLTYEEGLYYHGTVEERAKSILKQGLIPHKFGYINPKYYKGKRKNAVFLAKDKEVAMKYAFSTKGVGKPAIIELNIPKGTKIYQDVLQVGTSESYFKIGKIPPKWIKKVSFLVKRKGKYVEQIVTKVIGPEVSTYFVLFFDDKKKRIDIL